jgi:hypothetical protein
MPLNIRSPRCWIAALLLALLFASRAAPAQECQPSTNQQLTTLLDQSRNKIYLVKFDEAIEKLNAAEALVPCLTDALNREALSRLFLYRGVASFNKGDEAQAAVNFRQAVAVDRGTRWDERFGQRPREVFIEAKEGVLMAPKGQLRIQELRPRVLVYIDGEPSGSGTSMQVPVGRHLMQIKADDRIVKGAFFEVGAGKEQVPPVPPEYLGAAATASTARPAEGKTEETPKPAQTTGPEQVTTTTPPQREPEVESPPFDKTRLRPASYGFLGVGAAGLLTGVGAGVVTVVTQNRLKNEFYANRDDTEKDALLARQRITAYVADGAFGAAVLFGGVGATLFLLSRPPAEPAATRATVFPWATAEAVGVGVHGSF